MVACRGTAAQTGLAAVTNRIHLEGRSFAGGAASVLILTLAVVVNLIGVGRTLLNSWRKIGSCAFTLFSGALDVSLIGCLVRSVLHCGRCCW